jgi:hypothetical protein
VPILRGGDHLFEGADLVRGQLHPEHLGSHDSVAITRTGVHRETSVG